MPSNMTSLMVVDDSAIETSATFAEFEPAEILMTAITWEPWDRTSRVSQDERASLLKRQVTETVSR
jgi:hypothetical protein